MHAPKPFPLALIWDNIAKRLHPHKIIFVPGFAITWRRGIMLMGQDGEIGGAEMRGEVGYPST